ncbi:MAG: HEAT repeat domain-containing protein [Planctomycetaceae bacterium]
MRASCRGFLVLITLSCNFSKSGAAEFDLNGKHFNLADGLTIELAADPEMTLRPICVDFDEQGRLYVAESSGSNEPVQKQLEEKPHSVLRLEDTDGDGVFDRRTVFADRLMFPEGCEWHDGSLYVGAPPQIWKLTDTDDDGVADVREVWFDGKTLTGCANDLHGPYTGPDGVLYWCKGAFAEQTHHREVGESFVTRASHIFRHDPLGGHVEPILTGGMDNPVEVAFTRDGEPILSCTFLQRPAGGNRDGLIHAVYGGVWGKVNGALDGHPRTGELMPPLVHLGAAAPCGLLRVEGSGLRVESSKRSEDESSPSLNPQPSTLNSSDVLLACSFNMHKITRHVLHPEGATYATTDDDLLVCDDVDFHPTDVIEDADGSLLVIDTGGWYKLCCPTSQLHKPDVPGAIYRVRRTDAAPVEDPRGLSLEWKDASPDDLAKRLHDPRYAVRLRAVDELGKRGAAAVPVLSELLKSGESVEARRLAVWALTRTHQPEVRATVRIALEDSDPSVQRTAAHSAGLWRDAGAAKSLRRLLKDAAPHTRRVAAAALGRIGDPAAVDDLLAAASTAVDDRFLHHAVTFALIEIGDAKQTRAGLSSDQPGTIRAALLALDQMPDGELTAEGVISRLEAESLRETVLFLLEQHPEWDESVADFLEVQLTAEAPTAVSAEDLQSLASRFATRPAVSDRLAGLVADGPSEADRHLVLKAMASRRKALPAAWTTALVTALNSDDQAAIPLAITVASSAEKIEGDAEALRTALRAAAGQEALEPEARLLALRAASAGARLDDTSFGFLQSQLSAEQSVDQRLVAADVLVAAAVTPAQLQTLSDSLPELGPMELDRVLPAFAKGSDDETGRRLVEALSESDAAVDIAPEKLVAAFAKFSPGIVELAKPLLERPQADAEARRARLDEMLATVGTGDPRRGQAIFQSSKAACATCHAIGYLGGRIGPDLTRIGEIRTERDLLEAILFPNASFVRSYEPVLVLTTEGHVHNGIPREDAGDSLTLATAADKTVSIPRDEIEDMRPGTVSIMPAGLEKQLTPQELADLVIFLKTAR